MTHPILLLTGMSGSGRSFALKTLEDMGYEAIDNLPLSLLPQTLDVTEGTPIVINIDVRAKDFSSPEFLSQVKRLCQGKEDAQLIFLDCDTDVLARRFNQTRRRHPLAHKNSLDAAIQAERQILTALKNQAHLTLDTSLLSTKDLARTLRQRFRLDHERGISIFVTSFSYRLGIPREADMVLDARLLDNPHYDERLRPLTGEDKDVQAYIRQDPLFAPFVTHAQGILDLSVRRFEEEGRPYFTLAVGCTGGRHRSVYVARALTEHLKTCYDDVTIQHRDTHLS